MPKFRVVKGHDAWARYVTVVEAESAPHAVSKVTQLDYDGEWVRDGFSEFDDKTIFSEEVREVSGEAVAEKSVDLLVTEAERDTILAALRFYQERGQGDPMNRSDAIHDIATNNGNTISLDAGAIDKLIEEKINV